LRPECRRRLLAWFDKSQRELPWRQTRDPYRVWVSEIMCQQTQVATVIPYYLRWMERFPTLPDLARASEEEVLLQWQGLGYYRRGRMLRTGAQQIHQQGWPASALEWRSVAGVGPYTAAAIASICLGEPVAVVDGNVERVYARFMGDSTPGESLQRPAAAWAQAWIDPSRPGDWNQALMELGALICRPQQPQCSQCPLASECRAKTEGRIDQLPVPKTRRPTVELRLLTLVPVFGAELGVELISEGSWWKGLYQFPTAKSRPVAIQGPTLALLPRVRHQVTHHKLAFESELIQMAHRDSSLFWFPSDQACPWPLPVPQQKILAAARDFLNSHSPTR